MPKIDFAQAYANDEVAYIAWRADSKIEGALGFEITRLGPGAGEERVLPAWVPFKGQKNADWTPQDTSVWPIQKFVWRDLTARKRRDGETVRPDNISVRYRIRAVGPHKPGLEPVPPTADLGQYEGQPIALSYYTEAIETAAVKITSDFGPVRAAFTNGILAAQWLTRALPKGASGTADLGELKRRIAKSGDPLRSYLSGDVLAFLRSLLERAKAEDGEVYLALYELDDEELLDLLLANEGRIHIILSNTSVSKPKSGRAPTGAKAKPEWDKENAPARQKLKQARVDIQNRMFNNSSHIGHNKFAVYVDKAGTPQTVLSGSTNWTPNGLCAQTNNAMLIEDAQVAKTYLDAWKRLHADRLPDPRPLSAASTNAQGAVLRTANKKSTTINLADSGSVEVWFSPNTTAKTKNASSPTPPDLSVVYALMRQAKQAVFFLAFLPGMAGVQSIIEEAIKIGDEDAELLVLGAVSSPMAMPTDDAHAHAPAESVIYHSGKKAPADKNPPAPTVFQTNGTEIVRAFNITGQDVVGDFQAELLSAGNAIIHDKIVVIDPLSDDCVVVMGSHNLGYKASYGNDENLLIFRGNTALAQAYMVHVLDVYEHYRFRAVQWDRMQHGEQEFEGFLETDDTWQDKYFKADAPPNEGDYLAGKRP